MQLFLIIYYAHSHKDITLVTVHLLALVLPVGKSSHLPNDAIVQEANALGAAVMS